MVHGRVRGESEISGAIYIREKNIYLLFCNLLVGGVFLSTDTFIHA